MNLGGTHTAVSGTIDFSTGKVTGERLAGLDNKGNGLTPTGDTTEARNGVSYPLHQAGGSMLKGIAAAYASSSNSIMEDSDGNIYNVYKGVRTKVIDGKTGLLASSGSHSIDFFCLERGAGDSNLSVKYKTTQANVACMVGSDGTYTIPITYDSSTGKASYGILVPQGDSTADWSYTIRESNGHLAGMTYDSTEFTVNGSTTVSTVSLATGTRTVRTGLVTKVLMNRAECDGESCTVVGDDGTGDYTGLRLTNSLKPVMAGMVNTGSRSVWLIVVTVVGLAGAGIALRRFL